MSTSEALEIESKFDVPEEVGMPDLHTPGAVDSVAGPVVHSLSAIYWDTEDLRLTRSRRTLRRRTGGTDAGWHLKLPAGGETGGGAAAGRREISFPLGDDPDELPPAEILAPVLGLVRDLPLRPIARIDNERTVLVAIGTDGLPAAEVCDDRVTASSLLPGGATTGWREWEVELIGHGDEHVLTAVSRLLTAAGAHPSESPSKLARALGDSADAVPDAFPRAEVDPDSAAFLLLEAVARHRDRMLDMDPAVRRDDWDSIHQMRVATRELRSNLQTFGRLLELPDHGRLLGELRWFAGVLGVARDAEVVGDRFRELVAEEPAELIPDEARRRLDEGMRRVYRDAHAASVAEMGRRRYFGILDGIEALLAAPPLTEAAAGRPRKVLGKELESAHRKLVRSITDVADPALSDEERSELFHEVRKKAKKLRYSAQAAESDPAMRVGDVRQACKTIQSVLGDFQDSVEARKLLLRIADEARAAGEDAFAYGLLYQREREIGWASLEGYDAAVAALDAAWAEYRRERGRGAAKHARKKGTKKAGKKSGKKTGTG